MQGGGSVIFFLNREKEEKGKEGEKRSGEMGERKIYLSWI